ncbi:MAG: transposase, partial [Anaerolineae bacterium]
LGKVVDGEMRLNEWGQAAHDYWHQVPVHFPSISIDAFTTMPNHVHAVVVIQVPAAIPRSEEKGEETSPLHDAGDNARDVVAAHTDDKDGIGRGAVAAPRDSATSTGPSQMKRPSLGQTVAYYKYQATKQINELRGIPGTPFWQRNYWEHIIRNDTSLNRIREYIEDNPARWADDQLHPNAPPNRFNQWPPR